MIHVKNLVKKYKIYKKEAGFLGSVKSLVSRDYDFKTAVDNVSFDIGTGEMVGYIGSNGAGKSTTIKMMTGILVPTSGTCLVNGVVPYKDRKKNTQKIGVVFGQRSQLCWDLPLRESFLLLKDIYGLKKNDYIERMEFLMELLDLKDFIDTPVRLLSLGQKMRGDLAASLIHNPPILFLDEPTIGLDIVIKEKIIKAIRQMNFQYNTTVILTTHDLGDVEQLCKRIILIDNGKKVYDGELDKIKNDYGYMRTIKISVENIDDIKGDLRLDKKFNLSNDKIFSWKEDKYIYVSFDKNVIGVTEIISFLMLNYSVLDFRIKEMEISEIVKKIYAHEVKI